MKTINQFATSLLLATTTFVASATVSASDWNTNDAGVVLDGIDVVAYRTVDGAIPGTPAHQSQYDGATFHFSNAENKAVFDAAPKKYAPLFNGYCAFAAGAKNAKVPANADSFKLYQGHLLVFFNDHHDGKKFNTKIPWNNNEQVLFDQARNNWKTLSH